MSPRVREVTLRTSAARFQRYSVNKLASLSLPSPLEDIHSRTLLWQTVFQMLVLASRSPLDLTFDTGAAVHLSRFHSRVMVTPLSKLWFQRTDSDQLWLPSAGPPTDMYTQRCIKIKGLCRICINGGESMDLAKKNKNPDWFLKQTCEILEKGA